MYVTMQKGRLIPIDIGLCRYVLYYYYMTVPWSEVLPRKLGKIAKKML